MLLRLFLPLLISDALYGGGRKNREDGILGAGQTSLRIIPYRGEVEMPVDARFMDSLKSSWKNPSTGKRYTRSGNCGA